MYFYIPGRVQFVEYIYYTLFFNHVTIYNMHVARVILLINNNKLMTTVADAVAATRICTTAPLHANISDSR